MSLQASTALLLICFFFFAFFPFQLNTKKTSDALFMYSPQIMCLLSPREWVWIDHKVCNTWYLLLHLCSPARPQGFTILGEIFAYVTVSNPTTEVVTFRLRGWYMLGVFLLPAFTHLRHERQDLLSLYDGIHALIWKNFGGSGVRTHVNSKGKIPSPWKTLPKGSNPQHCIKQDSKPNEISSLLLLNTWYKPAQCHSAAMFITQRINFVLTSIRHCIIVQIENTVCFVCLAKRYCIIVQTVNCVLLFMFKTVGLMDNWNEKEIKLCHCLQNCASTCQ